MTKTAGKRGGKGGTRTLDPGIMRAIGPSNAASPDAASGPSWPPEAGDVPTDRTETGTGQFQDGETVYLYAEPGAKSVPLYGPLRGFRRVVFLTSGWEHNAPSATESQT